MRVRSGGHYADDWMQQTGDRPGTIVEGKLNSWDDYEGDQLQVKIDGVTYLVHSSNVVLRH